MKQVHVFYRGHVQGVGFRYTVQDAAMRLGVNGWVRNLRDGRVEMVAQGSEAELQDLLHAIEHGTLHRYITQPAISWESPADVFEGFAIRRTL